MSLRDNSTHSLVTMVTQFGHAEYEQGQYNRLILQALLPEVKMGLRNKQEVGYLFGCCIVKHLCSK